ncbi:MAG TPA: ATP-binding protein [Candidatus Paceibacterota bacterium]|nr:ATP-binding protein [Candidatus Paceibacterota bacterium]
MGGPCAGKTTILSAIREEFADQTIFVPEVATLLLEGGFPIPGTHLPWSEKWQSAFQSAVLPLQQALEDTNELVAEAKGRNLIICDRGLLDGAAYTPGGVAEFCRRYNLNYEKALANYTAIIHLESLATSDPQKYGKRGNASRFETVERAREIELAVREAWKGHPRYIFVGGKKDVSSKISEVVGMVRFLLSEK